jgi:uncharacterized protein (TIGR02246 family)
MNLTRSRAVLAAATAFVAVAWSAVPTAAHARSEECRATTDTEIAELFEGWNAALATGEPKRVVVRYAVDSILLPTVSNKPRLTPEEKRDYFEMFLKLKPQGRIDMRVIHIDCNTAFDAGVYTFTLGDGRTVQARYTFTYGWDGQRWAITSHHSSAMPERG